MCVHVCARVCLCVYVQVCVRAGMEVSVCEGVTVSPQTEPWHSVHTTCSHDFSRNTT